MVADRQASATFHPIFVVLTLVCPLVTAGCRAPWHNRASQESELERLLSQQEYQARHPNDPTHPRAKRPGSAHSMTDQATGAYSQRSALAPTARKTNAGNSPQTRKTLAERLAGWARGEQSNQPPVPVGHRIQVTDSEQQPIDSRSLTETKSKLVSKNPAAKHTASKRLSNKSSASAASDDSDLQDQDGQVAHMAASSEQSVRQQLEKEMRRREKLRAQRKSESMSMHLSDSDASVEVSSGDVSEVEIQSHLAESRSTQNSKSAREASEYKQSVGDDTRRAAEMKSATPAASSEKVVIRFSDTDGRAEDSTDHVAMSQRVSNPIQTKSKLASSARDSMTGRPMTRSLNDLDDLEMSEPGKPDLRSRRPAQHPVHTASHQSEPKAATVASTEGTEQRVTELPREVAPQQMSTDELALTLITRLKNQYLAATDEAERDRIERKLRMAMLALEDIEAAKSSARKRQSTDSKVGASELKVGNVQLASATEVRTISDLDAESTVDRGNAAIADSISGPIDESESAYVADQRRQPPSIPQETRQAGLQIHNLAFCTEVSSFGVLERFPSYKFRPSQEVLLYCELENYVSRPVADGFETRLQGSYEILDSGGRLVLEQRLPEDTDHCANRRRDFYIAYRLHMPKQIGPGTYRLRLKVEDMHGRRYAQSSVAFAIKP